MKRALVVLALVSFAGCESAAKHPAYPDTVERLRSLEPARVHFAHDPEVWERG